MTKPRFHPATNFQRFQSCACLRKYLESIYSDNGSCYRAHAMRAAVAALGLKHRLNEPYTPKTNAKAERFSQTSLREWAYAQRLLPLRPTFRTPPLLPPQLQLPPPSPRPQTQSSHLQTPPPTEQRVETPQLGGLVVVIRKQRNTAKALEILSAEKVTGTDGEPISTLGDIVDGISTDAELQKWERAFRVVSSGLVKTPPVSVSGQVEALLPESGTRAPASPIPKTAPAEIQDKTRIEPRRHVLPVGAGV